MQPIDVATIARLNEECFCLPLERAALQAAAAARLGAEAGASAAGELEALSAGQPLFLPTSLRDDLFHRARAVGALLLALAATRARAARRPFDPEALAAAGTYNSFDFHLAASGPKLIEVNTNAGGAFLQPLFLDAVSPARTSGGFAPEEMLLDAWARLRPGRPLRRVAIVDDAPETQALYLDMRLCAAALEARGIAVDILDRAALRREGGALLGPRGPIDMVYNRLVDFHLREPESAALKGAWEAGEAVVAPNPDVYRAFADKHLLIALSDPEAAAALAAEAHADAALVLDTVPHTELVGPASAERLWEARRDYVFKPAEGYASRGVYRGDKISRKKWCEIAGEAYLAQRFAEPSQRALLLAGGPAAHKADIRVWAHGAEPLFAAARLYGGQVTGFRGEGAGFAPILWLESATADAGCAEAGCAEAQCTDTACGATA
ncbi:hypothetical protein [Parvibaculum sp.]|uniref:hypothetical protein n=1 Tax=Parvibaculum sp. TaxID=2024848 RepID=UPI0027306476|nr:hypothetical protein [Parvibaculum sp.]MDP1628488.1 hypothetical protein [Parvibaculum sp.]MDP2151820.1 hypothetical protein [Parvibaculum sp.]MDP3326943.1 hypothetical protein [Parvibaculum sp.]